MKVLHIPTGGLLADGIFSCITAYIQAMDRTDLEITILATNNPEQEIIDQIEKLDCRMFVIPNRKQNTKKYIAKLYWFLTRHSFDIVHVHGSSSIMCLELFTARLAGCKIRIAHSHNTTCEHKKLNMILRPIFNCSFNYAFACGQEAGKWLFKNREFFVLPNGRDLKKYEYHEQDRIRWRSNLKIPSESLVIGHVGRFNYQKNHEYLIQIFKEISEKNKCAHLVLIGTGEFLEKIKKQVGLLGLSDKVHFMGVINHVEELLSAMDIMLLPSYYEGLPVVVIEWQISNLPCIISDKITDECMITGLIQKMSIREDPKVWADAVMYLPLPDRNNMEIEEEIRKAGYDIEFGAKKLKQLYQSLMTSEALFARKFSETIDKEIINICKKF